MKNPAFLFYTSDFITGTLFMNNEEVGAYIRVLCMQHQKGHLTEKEIKNICKKNKIFLSVISHFKQDKKGLFYNKRLDREKEKREKYSESRANNRKKSTKDIKNISSTYENISNSYERHMENENEDENINNNINNNIHSMVSKSESNLKRQDNSRETLPENSNLDAIKEFIEKLPSDAAACQIIIKPINEYTEQKFPTLKACCDEASNDTNLDRNGSPKPSSILPNPATKRFLSHYLLTYLNARAKTYATRDHNGRIYWISNLIKYDFMHKKMDWAVSDFIKQHGGSERAMQQQNRPLSPYEYQDPLTHQRLYDFTSQDGKQCQARIPANAAPRPSDTVYWNKFCKTWMEWRN